MADSVKEIKLRSFNARGLKKRLFAVDQLTTEAAILRVCETWAREDNEAVTETLDGSSALLPVGCPYRVHAGVGVIKNPLLRYVVR